MRSVGISLPVTAGLVRSFYEATWGSDVWQVASATASEGGFDIGYQLPDVVNANGYLQDYSLFQSASMIQDGLNAMHEQYANKGEKAQWYDYAKVSLDIAAAGVETTLGVFGAETGIGVVAAIDGSTRLSANIIKLSLMMKNRNMDKAGAIPTNIGALVGAGLNHVSGQPGQLQSIFGTGNDVASMFINI